MTTADADARPRSERTARDAVAGQVLGATERLLRAGERYASLSVQAICTEAGVSRSAFYVNFADKTDLLLRMLERAMAEILGLAGQWLLSEPILALEPLVDAQHRAIGVYREHAALLRAVSEVAAYDDAVAEIWSNLMDGTIKAFAERIREGQRAGLVRSELAPMMTAKFVVFGSDHLLRHEMIDGPPSADRRKARQAARTIWTLLHSPTAGDP